MIHRIAISTAFLIWLGLDGSLVHAQATTVAPALQLTTALGRKITSLEKPPEELVQNYEKAKQRFKQTPNDAGRCDLVRSAGRLPVANE